MRIAAAVAAASLAVPAHPVLPGLTAAFVLRPLRQLGLTCLIPRGPEPYRRECDLLRDGVEYGVGLVGASATSVWRVDASVIVLDKRKVGARSLPFLSFVATLPYRGAQPQRARAWLARWIDGTARTTIGGVRFSVAPTDQTRELHLVAG